MFSGQNSRVAIVTGGSRGIGRAIVSTLAADGFQVVFSFASNEQAARRVEEEEGEHGHRVRGVQFDQGDISGLPAFFDDAMAYLGGSLDAFVANAGTIVHASIAETTVELFDQAVNVNLRGTFFSVKHAASHMRDGGRIVCISTIGTAWPSAGEAAYVASKAGIEQLSRVASRELGSRGITVNCISPGPTDTDMLRATVDERARQGVAAMTALGRLGTPTEIAAAVSVLLSPAAGWLTGQNIRADGGLT